MTEEIITNKYYKQIREKGFFIRVISSQNGDAFLQPYHPNDDIFLERIRFKSNRRKNTDIRQALAITKEDSHLSNALMKCLFNIIYKSNKDEKQV